MVGLAVEPRDIRRQRAQHLIAFRATVRAADVAQIGLEIRDLRRLQAPYQPSLNQRGLLFADDDPGFVEQQIGDPPKHCGAQVRLVGAAWQMGVVHVAAITIRPCRPARVAPAGPG